MQPRRRSGLLVIALALAGASCTAVASDPDAPPPAPAGPNRVDLVSAGGRVQGGGFTLEFELGHAVGQEPGTGGGLRLETGTAVRP